MALNFESRYSEQKAYSKWKRNQSAKFVLGTEATDKALNDLFSALPEAYRNKGITNIYVRVLRKMQGDIRARIRSNSSNSGRQQTGMLEGMVNVMRLRPTRESKDPAAMVHMTAKSQRGKSSVRTRKTLWMGRVSYAYAMEYGTPDRRKKKKQPVYTSGSGWATTDETGRIKPGEFAYFRPVVDQYRPSAERQILSELAKTGKREWERQARAFNKKGGTIKINV